MIRILVYLFFFQTVICAAGADSLTQAVQVKLDSLSSGSFTGFSVRDVKTDSLLLDIRGGQNAVPASTMKMFTTWVALVKLGPGQTFKTALKMSGKVKEGTLSGRLVIQGGGDPAFASRLFGPEHSRDSIFSIWHKALRKKGIKGIRGCVAGSEGGFARGLPDRHAAWEDVGNYYGGMTSGLCYNDNRYRVLFTGASSVGDTAALIGVQPEYSGVTRFDGLITAGPPGSSDMAFIFGSPVGERRLLMGTYPAGKDTFDIQGSLPFPSWTCAMAFRRYLQDSGFLFDESGDSLCSAYISRPGPWPAGSDSLLKEIAVHESPPLHNIIKYINNKSDNNYAQQLLCLMSKAAGGPGTHEDGMAVLRQYLDRQGFGQFQYSFVDGCGLTRRNWVSAQMATKFLSDISRRKYFKHFSKSLLTGDKKGFGKEWKDRIRIKTGYLEGVYAVGGYLNTVSGKQLAFYFVINQHNRKVSDVRDVLKECLEMVRTTY